MSCCDKCVNLIKEDYFSVDGDSYESVSCLENWIPFEHENCKEFEEE